MPVRRRADKRRAEVTDEHEAWLHGRDTGCGLIPYGPPDELAALWATQSERILAEHVTVYPGHRPARWWRYEAREPRQRLGGIGTPAADVLAHAPSYYYGLPAVWVSAWEVKYYSGIAVDVHGNPIGDRIPNNDFKGVAIDPNDPPKFESQAAYLLRHGLFLTGEERRLKKADFEPEQVS
jgi:hypothetical protein